MYIWYDDRFTQMKRSNAHEVTLGAVLGICCSCIYVLIYAENTASITRSSMYVCSKRNRTSVSFINRDAELWNYICVNKNERHFIKMNVTLYKRT